MDQEAKPIDGVATDRGWQSLSTDARWQAGAVVLGQLMGKCTLRSLRGSQKWPEMPEQAKGAREEQNAAQERAMAAERWYYESGKVLAGTP